MELDLEMEPPCAQCGFLYWPPSDPCERCGFLCGAEPIRRHLEYPYAEWTGEGVGCAHGCKSCERRGRSVSPDPDTHHCRRCGHTFHLMAERRYCSLCDAVSENCPMCRPGGLGRGEHSGRWFCLWCWADHMSAGHSASLVFQLQGAACADEQRVRVSCLALSGEEKLVMDVSRNGGLAELRAALRKQYGLEPRRLARDLQAYTEAEFQERFGPCQSPDRSRGKGSDKSCSQGISHSVEQLWQEAPPLATTEICLLLDGAPLLPANDSLHILAAVPGGGLAVQRLEAEQ